MRTAVVSMRRAIVLSVAGSAVPLVWAGCYDQPGSPGQTVTADASTASESSGSGTGATTSSTTTNDPTTTGSPSGTTPSTQTGDTTTGESGTEPGTMTCLLACDEPQDCCPDPMCERMFGTYPYDYACEPDGTCTNRGCTTDDDCSAGGTIVGAVCVTVDGIGACYFGCVDDADCTAMGAPDTTCTGDDGSGGLYCELPACTSDAECGEPFACGDDGTCAFFCALDEHCGGLGVCNAASGACECPPDGECGDGYTCAALD